MEKEWSLFGGTGRVLVWIARHPGCTCDEICAGLSITARTAWSHIGRLRRAGMIKARTVNVPGRCGRRWHAYTVNWEREWTPGHSLLKLLGDVAGR